MPSRLLLAYETTPGQWTCLQESQSHRASPLDLYSSAVKSCYKCPCGETEGQLRHSGVQKWIATLQLLLNELFLWALGCFCPFCDEYKKINSTKSFLSFPFLQKYLCDQHECEDRSTWNNMYIKRSDRFKGWTPGFLEALLVSTPGVPGVRP